MALQMNLEKSTQSLALCLSKVGVTTVPAVEVAFGLDVSGSFEDEHLAGVTNDLMTRLVPWGLLFDPDKKMDVFTFSNGPQNVQEVGAVDAKNYEGFVRAKIIDKVQGWNGGTDYSYLLTKTLEHFGWKDTVKKAGFFGKLVGQKDKVTAGAKKKSLVIVATDGDCYSEDKARVLDVLAASEKRGDQVYFMFLGISNQGSSFPFLERLGDKFNNTGFVAIDNLRRFVQLSDEELNNLLINSELSAWLKN